eukprot:7870155-Pyramimonas_sp.AAC.1
MSARVDGATRVGEGLQLLVELALSPQGEVQPSRNKCANARRTYEYKGVNFTHKTTVGCFCTGWPDMRAAHLE